MGLKLFLADITIEVPIAKYWTRLNGIIASQRYIIALQDVAHWIVFPQIEVKYFL